jgi:hypothetical protein
MTKYGHWACKTQNGHVHMQIAGVFVLRSSAVAGEARSMQESRRLRIGKCVPAHVNMQSKIARHLPIRLWQLSRSQSQSSNLEW